jgi:hypothetical protein
MAEIALDRVSAQCPACPGILRFAVSSSSSPSAKDATSSPADGPQYDEIGGVARSNELRTPDPELLHDILHGTGSNLRWADTYEPYVAPKD